MQCFSRYLVLRFLWCYVSQDICVAFLMMQCFSIYLCCMMQCFSIYLSCVSRDAMFLYIFRVMFLMMQCFSVSLCCVSYEAIFLKIVVLGFFCVTFFVMTHL